MYERVVDVPRLVASDPDDGPAHPILDEMALAIGKLYGTVFDRRHMSLYRDGRDSVAMHRDHVIRYLDQSLVAILSVGEPRRFLLRPFERRHRGKDGRGRTRRFKLGWGDLFVMGGSCQRDWEHGIPKTGHAGPRLSVMFRRSRETDMSYAPERHVSRQRQIDHPSGRPAPAPL